MCQIRELWISHIYPARASEGRRSERAQEMIEFQLGKFPLVTTPHTSNFRGSIKLQSSSTVYAYAEGQDRRQATHRGAGIPVKISSYPKG